MTVNIHMSLMLSMVCYLTGAVTVNDCQYSLVTKVVHGLLFYGSCHCQWLSISTCHSGCPWFGYFMGAVTVNDCQYSLVTKYIFVTPAVHGLVILLILLLSMTINIHLSLRLSMVCYFTDTVNDCQYSLVSQAVHGLLFYRCCHCQWLPISTWPFFHY